MHVPATSTTRHDDTPGAVTSPQPVYLEAEPPAGPRTDHQATGRVVVAVVSAVLMLYAFWLGLR